MATHSMRVLICLTLLATTLSVGQALREDDCREKGAKDSIRCVAASLSFCERWVCQQNVNRKLRMCLASTSNATNAVMKDSCDRQQWANPTLAVCEFPPGTFTDVGLWYNKAWCDRNNASFETITPTVHAESQALNIIISNRTKQAEDLIANTTCIDGVPSDPTLDLPQCVCLVPVPDSCVEQVRTDVIAAYPDVFPTPSFNDTVSSILLDEFNYTWEEATWASSQATCNRFPDLDQCQRPSPAPARRLLQPYTV